MAGRWRVPVAKQLAGRAYGRDNAHRQRHLGHHHQRRGHRVVRGRGSCPRSPARRPSGRRPVRRIVLPCRRRAVERHARRTEFRRSASKRVRRRVPALPRSAHPVLRRLPPGRRRPTACGRSSSSPPVWTPARTGSPGRTATVVFEVDRPEVLEFKREVLGRARRRPHGRPPGGSRRSPRGLAEGVAGQRFRGGQAVGMAGRGTADVPSRRRPRSAVHRYRLAVRRGQPRGAGGHAPVGQRHGRSQARRGTREPRSRKPVLQPHLQRGARGRRAVVRRTRLGYPRHVWRSTTSSS